MAPAKLIDELVESLGDRLTKVQRDSNGSWSAYGYPKLKRLGQYGVHQRVDMGTALQDLLALLEGIES